MCYTVLMKLNEDYETLAINKVLILYVLNKINKPVTNSGLLELVLTIYEINYFYFQQFLLDLLEKKYIAIYTKEKEDLYEITPLGKKTLDLTKDILPGILTLKADTRIKGKLEKIEDKLSITSEYTPQDKDDYIVSCRIVENNSTIFEVKTFAGSQKLAKSITENWNKNAIKIYPKILKILTK